MPSTVPADKRLDEKRGKIRYGEKGGSSGQPRVFGGLRRWLDFFSSVLSYIYKEAEVRYAAWILVLVLVFRVKRLGREGYICRRALPDGVWIFLGKYRNGKASRRCGLG